MKIFPIIQSEINPLFYREARFADKIHPNIVSIKMAQTKRTGYFQSKSVEFSYVLMDYAPYGDFFKLIKSQKFPNDEKLIRTYFHQLILGLEYLHKEGIAHLDIKLENLLLTQDFALKIADFDLSFVPGDREIASKGTLNYRAPELKAGVFKNLAALDIFAAGIVLFTLKSKILPYVENSLIKGVDLEALMKNNMEEFWSKHCQLQGRSSDFFDDDFKSLFESMIKYDPEKRANMSSIKNSKWFNGPTYSNDELPQLLNHYRLYLSSSN